MAAELPPKNLKQKAHKLIKKKKWKEAYDVLLEVKQIMRENKEKPDKKFLFNMAQCSDHTGMYKNPHLLFFYHNNHY